MKMTANPHFHLPKPEPYQRLGSGDGERKTLLTRQIAFEPLPASVLFALGGSWLVHFFDPPDGMMMSGVGVLGGSKSGTVKLLEPPEGKRGVVDVAGADFGGSRSGTRKPLWSFGAPGAGEESRAPEGIICSNGFLPPSSGTLPQLFRSKRPERPMAAKPACMFT